MTITEKWKKIKDLVVNENVDVGEMLETQKQQLKGKYCCKFRNPVKPCQMSAHVSFLKAVTEETRTWYLDRWS